MPDSVETPAKRQKTGKDAVSISTSGAADDTPEYTIYYWPGIPGRGEFIRLAFEEAGVPYRMADVGEVMALIGTDNTGDGTNPPPLAPPILEHARNGVRISQTANILMYLGPRLGLAPNPAEASEDDPYGIYRINALTMTAIDGLTDKVHDCHHPICSSLYYEDQKPESLRSSQMYVTYRLPKCLGYFERVLQGAEEKQQSGSGSASPWLYGSRCTYADLVLFQCLEGVAHMFPKAMTQARESGQYSRVFALREAVRARPNIAAYLASDRRLPFALGIYRYYEELDVLPAEKD